MAVFPRWNQIHALAMLGSAALVGWTGLPQLLGVVALISVATLLSQTRGAWTASGAFGCANWVTAFRFGLTLVLLWGGLALPGWLLAVIAFSIIGLDGVDGWAARRFQTQGEFGGRFDVAVDSIFVLSLSILLMARGNMGPWVLAAGLWHYVYVAAPLAFATERGEAQRSWWGASVFIVLVSALALGLVLPSPWGSALAAVAIVVQSASFIHSFWERYGAERLDKLTRGISSGG